MTRARGLLALAVLMLALAAPAPAAAAPVAPDPRGVAERLAADGYYVEPGSEPVDEAALRQALGTVDRSVTGVVIASDLEGGERSFAEDVLDALGTGQTVVVVSPAAIEVASDELTDAEIEQALADADRQVNLGAAGAGEIIAAFAAAVGTGAAGSPADGSGGTPSGDTGDGDGGLPVGVLLAVGGLGATGVAVLVSRRRSRAAEQQRRTRQVSEAREEVRGQVEVVAQQIVALNDRVEMAGRDDVSQLFGDAAASYQAAQDSLERAESVQALEQVSDTLDHARWRLESVAALLDGREPPPEPEREQACFFDPTHGAGTAEATISTPAGEQRVRVCSYCAAKLEAGQAPEPRMIQVDGQQVPAAKAPRSYGGGGLGWLGDFAIILGGRRLGYGWGRYGGWGRRSVWGRRGGWGGYGPGGGMAPRPPRSGGSYGGFGGFGGGFGGGGFGGTGGSRSRGSRTRGRGFGGRSRGGGLRGGGSRGRGGRRR